MEVTAPKSVAQGVRSRRTGSCHRVIRALQPVLDADRPCRHIH
jgi:hypothetical protein